MKKITICGASSMAGHVIYKYFSSDCDYEVNGVEESDIFEKESMAINREFLDGNDAEIFINCIRCLVENSEENPIKAIIYNSYFPRFLEKNYEGTKTKVIHLSSDCVFSGATGGYVEDAVHDGCSYYAKTKSLGEISNNKDITIRTSYIGPTLGYNREELFDWFLMQKGEIQGYCNALWTGVSTLELAKGIRKLIESEFSGLYHLVPSRKISKYDLLFMLRNLWGKEDVAISKDYSTCIDRSLVDSKHIIKVPDYETMFIELFEYMKKNEKLYGKYSGNNNPISNRK